MANMRTRPGEGRLFRTRKTKDHPPVGSYRFWFKGKRYNTGTQTFPAVLFAGALGFREADFHRLDDSEKGTVDQVPDVRF